MSSGPEKHVARMDHGGVEEWSERWGSDWFRIFFGDTSFSVIDVSYGDVNLSMVANSGPLMVRYGQETDHLRLYIRAENAGEGTRNGILLRPDTILACRPFREMVLSERTAAANIQLRIAVPYMEAMYRSIAQDELFTRDSAPDILQLRAQGPTRSLIDKVHDILAMAREYPEEFDREETHALMRADLVSTASVALASAAPLRIRSHRERLHCVNRALDYMEAFRASDIGLADLCRAVGASERTLRYAFLDILGTTPARFVKRHRLYLVRRALLEAEPGATVGRVAMRYGFWAPARFAADYHALFHEKPSETLRRSRR